jgi:hypothetical protein
MPETISEARTRLPAHVRRFREQGLDAEPVILGDLPYLLAGLRLGRLDDPVRRSEAQRRVARIRQLRDRDRNTALVDSLDARTRIADTPAGYPAPTRRRTARSAANSSPHNQYGPRPGCPQRCGSPTPVE